MTSPAFVKTGGGSFHAASGLAATGHGIGAGNSPCLQILHIYIENNSTSSPPTVSSCFSDNGLTWNKLVSFEHTELAANGGGVSVDNRVRLEIWWTTGAVTNGGTFGFNLSGSVDGCCWLYYAYNGHNQTQPFDQNASLMQNLTKDASGTFTTSVSTDTSNVVLMAISGGSGGVNQTAPRFNSLGTDDDRDSTNQFSGTRSQRFYSTAIHSTTGYSNQTVGYSAALNNGAQANMEMFVYAITADAQISGPHGPMAVTEATDTMSARGYPGDGFVTGFMTPTEAKDAMAATGSVAVVGFLSSQEATDRFSAFGRQPQNAVMAAVEAPDRMHATGIGLGEDGTMITTEAPDHMVATGSVPFIAQFGAHERADHFRAIGAGVVNRKKRRVFFVT